MRFANCLLLSAVVLIAAAILCAPAGCISPTATTQQAQITYDLNIIGQNIAYLGAEAAIVNAYDHHQITDADYVDKYYPAIANARSLSEAYAAAGPTGQGSTAQQTSAAINAVVTIAAPFIVAGVPAPNVPIALPPPPFLSTAPAPAQ